jgi:ribonuclease HII
MANYEMGEIEERFPFDEFIGIDEVGTGPLAGPVVAAAVSLDLLLSTQGIRDSKKLSALQRERMAEYIKKNAACYAIGIVEAVEIDSKGLAWASLQAKIRAVRAVLKKYSSGREPRLLVDGDIRLPGFRSLEQSVFPKGDNRSWNIAAASIIAKVHRDRLMVEAHECYPLYKFDKHKGYPTAEHKELLAKYGPCPIHRKIMRPVRELLNGS